MNTIHSNREQWLNAAVEELRPLFDANGKPLPANIRVACGFPSNAKRSGAIGECWSDAASADKTFEVLISPTIDDPMRVFDVLVHELCHSTAGAMNHGVAFADIAFKMHLDPSGPKSKPWKSTKAGAQFKDRFSPLVEALGAYPHAKLTIVNRTVQSTRMLKAFCPTCGYTVRLTAKWAAVGLPICPADSSIFVL